MSLAALIQLSRELSARQGDRFNGRVPRSREIVGYSKGHWLVEYTFPIPGGHSVESYWEADERSKKHQEEYPND